jgi:hypothetical protein
LVRPRSGNREEPRSTNLTAPGRGARSPEDNRNGSFDCSSFPIRAAQDERGCLPWERPKGRLPRVPPMRRSYGVLPMRRPYGARRLARGQPVLSDFNFSDAVSDTLLRSRGAIKHEACVGTRADPRSRCAFRRASARSLSRLTAAACTASRSSQDSRNSFLWFTTDPSRFEGTPAPSTEAAGQCASVLQRFPVIQHCRDAQTMPGVSLHPKILFPRRLRTSR